MKKKDRTYRLFLDDMLLAMNRVAEYIDGQISDKSIVGTELLFMQIESNEKIKAVIISNNNKIGIININLDKHISYLALPVYYGIKLNKTTLSAGFQISYVLASSGNQKDKTTYNYGEITTTEIKYDELNMDSYDFGLRAGIMYYFTNKLAVEGNYYRGINNVIGSGGPSDLHSKVMYFTLGLQYTIWIN